MYSFDNLLGNCETNGRKVYIFMNIIRVGREVIVGAQHLKQTEWEECINVYKANIAQAKREQRTTTALRTPRGKGNKCAELIKDFVESLRKSKAIKNSQVHDVTQFFCYKSFPKDIRQEQDIESERIIKFVDKILKQNVKTVTQKIHKERLNRLQRFYNTIDPYEASASGNEIYNLFLAQSEPLASLGRLFLEYLAAQPEQSLAKGVDLHNYCVGEMKSLIPSLQALAAGNKDRNVGEKYRILRLWAKCLFDLRSIMIRYHRDHPLQRLAVSMKDMDFHPRKTMDPISLDLCLAFSNAGKGKDLSALLNSPEIKLAAQERRSFLQTAKTNFERMERGEKLSYDVAKHEFDHRDNPLVVLKEEEKSYHLNQLIHTYCLKEISNLCNGDQDVALACHFASMIDQREGLAAFDELDKSFAEFVSAVPKARIRPEGANESVAPSASAGASGSENPGQPTAQKKKVRQKLVFADELPAAAPASGGNSVAPAPAPQSVPAAVTSPRDDKAIQAALARDIAKSNIAVAAAPQAAPASVTSPREAIQTALVRDLAKSNIAVAAAAPQAAQASASSSGKKALPATAKDKAQPSIAPTSTPQAVPAVVTAPEVNAVQVAAVPAPAPHAAPAAVAVQPAAKPSIAPAPALQVAPAAGPREVNVVQAKAAPAFKVAAVPAASVAPAAVVPKAAQIVPPLVQNERPQPLAKSIKRPATSITPKREKGILGWVKNRCNRLMSSIKRFWNWLLRKN
ncbi:MAG: hypothetical protein LLG04_02470 [Parachlamydia sp.]|nr:hypothetical protein [Parachlamydia sp.]